MPHPPRVSPLAALALAAGLLAPVATGCSRFSRDDDEATGSHKRTVAPARRGWLPDGAKEATWAQDLSTDPNGDPLCQEKPSPIDIGKAFAGSLERELRESTKISDEEEMRIGKKLEGGAASSRDFAGKWDLPDDLKTWGKYLNGLVQQLAKGKARPGIQYRVHIVRRPEWNAAALPGGALMVFTGLLEGKDAVKDEAELVAVLGHEIAHVEKRHTVAAYQYAKAVLGSDADAGMIAMKIITTPLSSEHELEADEHGLELAVRAQYDPMAAVNLWRRKAATDHGGPVNPLGQILEGVLRSHPKASIRACRAMQKVNWAHDHSPWDRLYDGKSSLRARVIGPTKPY